ncbi:MAG: citramalate synthase [Propionibacteriaceae bacterium]|nr:citramalate synthase [Propionibacteriaceae bacterium]
MTLSQDFYALPSLVAPETFQVYDTTLRDGAQQEGLRLTVADKLKIARHLDDFGVTFIEGGWPGANPGDTAFFEAVRAGEITLKHSLLSAFGSTRRVGRAAADDPMVAAVRDSGAPVACLVAKSHVRHVELALRTTLAENLEMIADTVTHLVAEGQRVFLDAEHFFDGYRTDRNYSLEVIRTAADAGAEAVVLCDTNGGMLPSWMPDIVGDAGEVGIDLGIHCHNDSGCAVANTIAAVEAGAVHVQGTINGYGERTGNADLVQVVANLELKYGWEVLPPGALAEATRISHAIAALTNSPSAPRQPYVGQSAFAHKAGLHASAVRVDPMLYQHVDPAVVGNDMRTLVSDMAGRANIQMKGEELGFDLSDRELAAQVTDVVKQREAAGYSYESADASFELLLRDATGQLPRPFVVQNWRVYTHSHSPEQTDTEATVKLTAKDIERLFVGEGNGPVNALDHALRRALADAYPQVLAYDLTDYRVRILDEGRTTDATVRVLIDTTDGERSWTTVGVGENVIEASWEALSDAYLYGLITEG